MWIATKHGFFSIVRAHAPNQPRSGSHMSKAPHPELCMVRARDRRHLEGLVAAVCPGTKIVDNTGTDYPCRIIVPWQLVVEVLMDAAAGLDYTNFKNAVKEARPKDKPYHDFLMGTWHSGLRMEPPKPDPRGAGFGLWPGDPTGAAAFAAGRANVLPPAQEVPHCLECDGDPDAYEKANGVPCRCSDDLEYCDHCGELLTTDTQDEDEFCVACGAVV